MIKIEIGDDPRHVDEEDMTALVEILSDEEHSASPGPLPVLYKFAEWILVLAVEAGYDLLLKSWFEERGKAIYRHFRKENKQPPAKIQIFGPGGEVLAEVAVDAEPESDGQIILP
jgi:hypothetical protein